MRAIDPARSRIVLIGSSSYRDPKLPNVPQVAANLADLAKVFTDPQLGGLLRRNCVVAPHAAGVGDVGDLLYEAAEQAEDLLLVYYAGHGVLSRNGDLYLSLHDTRFRAPEYSALRFETVRGTFVHSPAASRVVIVDSCYSGRAIGQTLGADDQEIIGQLEINGTYTLTSAPPNSLAMVRDGEAHTAFTERLLQLLNEGSPQAAGMLTLSDIYQNLVARLRRDGLPPPQKCGTATADLLGLIRNRQQPSSARPRGDGTAPANPQPARPEVQTSGGTHVATTKASVSVAMRGKVLAGGPGYANAAEFSPDGRLLAVAIGENIQLWDISTGKLEHTVSVPYAVGSMAFNGDGRLLAAVCAINHTVSLWDPISGQHLRTLEGLQWAGDNVVKFTSDGQLIVANDTAARLLRWHAETGEPLPSINLIGWSKRVADLIKPSKSKYDRFAKHAIAFSRDGRILAMGRADVIWLWNTTDGRQAYTLKGNGSIQALAISAEGLQLAARAENDTVLVWDAESGTRLAVFKGNRERVKAGYISLHGNLLATSDGERIQLWNVGNGELLHIFVPQQATAQVRSNIHCFGPDGRVLAVIEQVILDNNTSDARVQLWDILQR